jgi:RNA polymerase-binding transcription factor DksA
MTEQPDTKARLETQLEEAVQTLDRLEGHLRNTDRSIPQDWPEQAQFRENDEVLEALAARTREQIESLQRALERFGEGDFDTCSNCGKDIEPARREILPTTTVCSGCAPAV